MLSCSLPAEKEPFRLNYSILAVADGYSVQFSKLANAKCFTLIIIIRTSRRTKRKEELHPINIDTCKINTKYTIFMGSLN